MTALGERRGRPAAPAVLTLDEARAAVVRSAIACLEAARCNRDGQLAMLRGEPTHPSWGPSDQRVAARHRRLVSDVRSGEHGWVVDDELEGVIAATGLDDQAVAG